MRRAWIFGLVMAGFPLGGFAQDKVPTVVEMFTSKYCPSCPAAEHKMKGVANDEADLIVVFEHVDYWDRDAKNKDPFGLADATQRQYDYSNVILKRAGEVFTPMPVIDGQMPVPPPLMFTWSGALEKGRALPAKAKLETKKTADGSLEVTVPASLYGANREVWVLGLDPIDGTKALRARGIVQGNLAGRDKNGVVRVPAAMVPKGQKYLVLLQNSGPNAVIGVGTLGI